ncbi:MAG: VWA domain-containing protein [Gammaproteobacteria bacterium]|nr:VWA domain-containing protein [Gammaproteobacteria bacterium]
MTSSTNSDNQPLFTQEESTNQVQPLDAETMEEQLDQFLDPVLSFRRSAAGPAKQMSALNAKEQQFGLHWVGVIASTNAEMAYQYAAHFSDAVIFLQHDLDAVENWTIEAMSAFDERGLQLCIKILHNTKEFSENYFKKQNGIVLEDIKKLLTTFVCGLNGRALKVEPGQYTCTDTETIYLPEIVSDFSSKEDNFFYYKLLTVYQWSQNWFGTWRYDLNEKLNHFDDSVNALKLFHCLESIRLLNRIRFELPGFFRQAEHFIEDFNQLQHNGVSGQEEWQVVFSVLSEKTARIDDTFELLNQYYSSLDAYEFSFQGVLLPNKVQHIKERRLKDEKSLFREALARLADEKRQANPEMIEMDKKEPVFDAVLTEDSDMPDGMTFELTLDGQMIVPPDDVESLISSIIQDIGEIPEEYLVAAGPGKYVAENNASLKKTDDVWSGAYHEDGAYFYDEWDHVRQHHRKNWCVVREVHITPVYDDFVQKTLTNHLGVVKSLRRNFEALKGEEKLLKRQIDGDDIDIDALVESYADVSMGMELNERIFTRMQREDRNIAVMFMVDMSGSTKGWINQAEREALVLLCESLEMLGDRYAIYGFSGTTRKRCEIYHIKHIDEDYNDKVKARISGVTAKDYTRMGFAIRHLSALLEEVEARTKLLITLSDGKPEDYDGQYRGEYGIEDTRQSLFEARQKGIHPYCITIDKEAGDYLPHMYGAANYVLIEDINKLPLKVSDIYRKLTA